MVMDSLSLNIDELNKQIEIESLMPAELVSSAIKDITFTGDDGMTQIRRVWEILWDRLDMDMTGESGNKFLYQSSHWFPDPNRPVTNRRGMQYAKQIDTFAKLGLKGKNPEDFLGAKHWIRETVERNSTRPWWRSEALYKEGQSYEEAVGATAGSQAIDINPPSALSANSPTPELAPEEVAMEEGSPYDLLLKAIEGKTTRQALTALRNSEDIPEEMINAFQSGSLVDALIEQNFLTEGDDGKFHRVVS